MKFDALRTRQLIEKEHSLSGFAKLIGTSHTGIIGGIKNSTLKIDTLIKIAEYFNKPIEYFFTSDYENKHRPQESTEPKITTYSCPDCISKQKKIDEIESELKEITRKYILALEQLQDKRGCG